MNAQLEFARGKGRVAKDQRFVCNSGAAQGIGLHQRGVGWTSVSACSSAGQQVHSAEYHPGRSRNPTPVTQIPARGDTGVAGTHCRSAQGSVGVAACQRLWRPSFHLPGPSPSPEIHLGPCCTWPKERHPSLPLIEVFSQSITCGDAIKAN